MACEPVIDQPEVDRNDITFRGRCNGKCGDGEGRVCQARFSLTQEGKINKNVKVTASGYGGPQAFIRLSADDGDIDDGVVTLKCTCGNEIREVQYHFTLEHRITAEDVFFTIVTLGGRALVKLAGL